MENLHVERNIGNRPPVVPRFPLIERRTPITNQADRYRTEVTMILTGGLFFLSLSISGVGGAVGPPTPLAYCRYMRVSGVLFHGFDGELPPGTVLEGDLLIGGTGSFKFSPDTSPPAGKVSRCTGDIMYEAAPGIFPICGTMTTELAEKLCFELGISLDTGRSRQLFKCSPSTGAALGQAGKYYFQNGSDFNVGIANCPHSFCTKECFDDETLSGPNTMGTATPSLCNGPGGGSTLPAGVAAVTCEDRDECVEGALVNCHSGEEDDCVLVKACAHYTSCENTEGGYYCDCRLGFYAEDDMDKYNPGGAGCMDIDECALGTDNCFPDACENTPGSYRCTCDRREDYVYNATDTDKCKAKSCGDPGSDGNAWHNATLGNQYDVVHYKCLPGYYYEYGYHGYVDYYQKECDHGSWSNPTAKCVDIDECENGDDVCDEHAICKNTNGAYICICNHGYTGDGYECEEVKCGAPPKFKNTIYGYPRQNSYGGRVDYQCKEGYRVLNPTYWSYHSQYQPQTSSRSFSLHCMQGIWQPQNAQDCVPIRCPDPGVVSLTSRSESSFEYGETVTFTCPSGFEKYNSGGTTFDITCQEDGTWSDAATCVDIDECITYNPCTSDEGDDKHFCINLEGSFTCSCAWGYRLDKSGKACIGHAVPSGEYNWKDAPCDMYEGLRLCEKGSCKVNSKNYPYCVCVDGYTGAFCSIPPNKNTIALAALVIACIGLIFILAFIFILMCWICRPQPIVPVISSASTSPPPSYYGQFPQRRELFKGTKIKPRFKIGA